MSATREAVYASRATQDEAFMRIALALGRRGLGRTWPNPAVGAVLVREDGPAPVIVGRGWTQPGGRPHAEVEALRRAGAAARGATLYVTLEPCSHHGRSPPCADAVIAAGVRRVVSAMNDPNPLVAGEGHARLRAAGIAVEVGCCGTDARRDHAGHVRRMRDGRPHVTLKLAVSADGKVGLPGRKPVAITGEEARARVHLLRAQNDAVLVGIGTALADDPFLTCRLPGMADRSPVRVVLDAQLRLPPSSRLLRTARETALWLLASESVAVSDRAEAMRAAGAEVLPVPMRGPRLDLAAALRTLSRRGITRVLAEGGPTVAAALVETDLVDEAWAFHSPLRIGPDGVDAFEGLPVYALRAISGLRSAAEEQVGADRLEILWRESACSPGS